MISNTNSTSATSLILSEMHFDEFRISEAQYERKFYIDSLTSPEVEAIVKYNPAMFKEIYHKRYVNNIYLDNQYLRNYTDNIIGTSDRQKVRIRWYGNLLDKVTSPVLELKIKEGLTGWKKSCSLPSFQFAESYDFRQLVREFRKMGVASCFCAWMSSLQPTLINRYSRKYFQTQDKRFRITIDSEMNYGKLRSKNSALMNWVEYYPNTVLELKYAPDLDLNASCITSGFPFRLTKSSKYVTGIDALKSAYGIISN